MRPRRCVGTCQENLLDRKGRQSYILFAFRGVDFACRIHNKTRGKRVCGRFRSLYAYGQQERHLKNELETVRISKNPTTVVAANGEVLTKEEATVYVRELDLFVTVMLLEDTPAVLSLGKLCEELGKGYHWTSGQKPHLIENGRKMESNTRTMYHSLSLVCRRPRKIQQQKEVRV